jgi:hypothetical protein
MNLVKRLQDLDKDRMDRVIQEEDNQVYMRKQLADNLKSEMMA